MLFQNFENSTDKSIPLTTNENFSVDAASIPVEPNLPFYGFTSNNGDGMFDVTAA